MRKKKRQRFRAVQAVKAAAREKIGSPPPTRREPQQKKPQDRKYKLTLGELLGEE